jgi:hypothetical protein
MLWYWKKNILKIFFAKTRTPILIILSTNHLCIKGIEVCTNKGTNSLQRGDNHTNAKIGWGHPNFFSRITKPEKLTFSYMLSDVVDIQDCTNNGPKGREGPQWGKHFYLYRYWKKIVFSRTTCSSQFQSNLVQIIFR